jgi:hypothetical protein
MTFYSGHRAAARSKRAGLQSGYRQAAYGPRIRRDLFLSALNLRFHGKRRFVFSFSESTFHESTCTAGEHRFENQISESEFRSSLGRLRVANVFRFQQPFAAFLSQFSAIAKPCSVDSTGESLKTDRG